MENNHVLLHIVMFPWLAIGHLIPFLHLSKILAQKGHKISFVSTPRNIQRLPKIPPHLSPLINLITLPFPKIDNLPDHAESSMDIPHQKAQFLKIAFDLLKSPLINFLENVSPKPDWIIYDYASHWLPPIAAELGISRAYFSLFSAATMAFIGPPSLLATGADGRSKGEDFAVVPKWVPFESDVAYRLHEVMKYVEGSAGNNESGTSDTVRFGLSIGGSDLVLFRTCVDFEPEWFNFVCELYRQPVVPVGVLPQSPEDDFDNNENWIFIEEWLDKQRDNSVVLVALGTEAELSREELIELALGLEKCGLPFFWVLRNSPGSTRDESQVLQLLPNGFVERVKRRGLVHVGWVPQVKILNHSAVGGFLTHCGWNSVIEALGCGRVLILFPVMNDQGLNARLLKGKQVGVEIPRNEKDGAFTSDSVADSVRIAMVSREGESVRVNAGKMKELFGRGTRNDNYIDKFVSHLVKDENIPIDGLKVSLK